MTGGGVGFHNDVVYVSWVNGRKAGESRSRIGIAKILRSVRSWRGGEEFVDVFNLLLEKTEKCITLICGASDSGGRWLKQFVDGSEKGAGLSTTFSDDRGQVCRAGGVEGSAILSKMVSVSLRVNSKTGLFV